MWVRDKLANPWPVSHKRKRIIPVLKIGRCEVKCACVSRTVSGMKWVQITTWAFVPSHLQGFLCFIFPSKFI